MIDAQLFEVPGAVLFPATRTGPGLGVNRRREGLGKRRVGVNDDVGGMEFPGITQE